MTMTMTMTKKRKRKRKRKRKARIKMPALHSKSQVCCAAQLPQQTTVSNV
jgi:hypothetical protein